MGQYFLASSVEIVLSLMSWTYIQDPIFLKVFGTPKMLATQPFNFQEVGFFLENKSIWKIGLCLYDSGSIQQYVRFSSSKLGLMIV